VKKRRGLGIALSLALISAGGLHAGFERWVETAELPALHVTASPIVTDRDGVPLRVFLAADDRWRLPVALQTVDKGYLSQLIAYEDKRFWRHNGVDPIALLRAGLSSARAGRVVSGGSTLTMQTARLLDGGGTGRWQTKLRQIRLALALERRLSKEEILEIYLTRAPFGGNLEGIRAAAFSYFGKDARRLSPSEAALLVALPQARRARDAVLRRAAAKGVLDPSLLPHATRQTVPHHRSAFPDDAWHSATRARALQTEALTQRLDVAAGPQRALRALLAEVAPTLPPYTSAAAVVIEVETGRTLAQLGAVLPGEDARGGFIDMSRAVRSPGSALKPFVYALAFGQGVAHPETRLNDRPQDFGGYAPVNFDGSFRGPVSAREALQLSLNVPAVALLDATGPRRLMRLLEEGGADAKTPGDQPPGLTAALGGLGLTLEELTRLYTHLARGGATPEGRVLMQAEAAWHVTDILRGAPAPQGSRTGRLAFKTGTSYGHRDAWAVGYDGAHVIGLWVGRPDGGAVPGMTGLKTAAPLLFRAFDRLFPEPVPFAPAPPDTLTVAHADLPAPLRELRVRPSAQPVGTLAIAFPPNGARVALSEDQGPMIARARDGAPPFTWLLDGRPAGRSADRSPVLEWTPTGPGFVNITVIDRLGVSARTTVELVTDRP